MTFLNIPHGDLLPCKFEWGVQNFSALKVALFMIIYYLVKYNMSTDHQITLVALDGEVVSVICCFTVKQRYQQFFTIYRPLVMNNTTATTKFRVLFEDIDLTIFPGSLFIGGDFNFHLNVAGNHDAAFFSDLINMLSIISAS